MRGGEGGKGARGRAWGDLRRRARGGACRRGVRGWLVDARGVRGRARPCTSVFSVAQRPRYTGTENRQGAVISKGRRGRPRGPHTPPQCLTSGHLCSPRHTCRRRRACAHWHALFRPTGYRSPSCARGAQKVSRRSHKTAALPRAGARRAPGRARGGAGGHGGRPARARGAREARLRCAALARPSGSGAGRGGTARGAKCSAARAPGGHTAARAPGMRAAFRCREERPPGAWSVGGARPRPVVPRPWGGSMARRRAGEGLARDIRCAARTRDRAPGAARAHVGDRREHRHASG